MRQHHTDSITQSDAYIPSRDIFQRTQTPVTCRSSIQVCVLRLGIRMRHGCGNPAGSTREPGFSPPMPATVTSVMSDDQAQVWTLSSREIEELACFRC